jgi:hypothetical protein
MARPTNRRGLQPGLTMRPPPDPAVQQRAWAALALGVLSPLGLSMGLGGELRRTIYVVILAFVIGGLAVWLGVTSMRRARSGGTARPRGAMSGTVLGVLGLVFSCFALITFAAFWPQLNQLSNCMAGANTVSAQQACQNQFSKSVDGEIGVFGS